MRKKKRYFSRATCFVLCAVFALLFLLPTVLTITNSFMTQSEITASYGQVFENANDGKSYISKTINLKFIPDKVSFTQYFTVLAADVLSEAHRQTRFISRFCSKVRIIC